MMNSPSDRPVSAETTPSQAWSTLHIPVESDIPPTTLVPQEAAQLQTPEFLTAQDWHRIWKNKDWFRKRIDSMPVPTIRGDLFILAEGQGDNKVTTIVENKRLKADWQRLTRFLNPDTETIEPPAPDRGHLLGKLSRIKYTLGASALGLTESVIWNANIIPGLMPAKPSWLLGMIMATYMATIGGLGDYADDGHKNRELLDRISRQMDMKNIAKMNDTSFTIRVPSLNRGEVKCFDVSIARSLQPLLAKDSHTKQDNKPSPGFNSWDDPSFTASFLQADEWLKGIIQDESLTTDEMMNLWHGGADVIAGDIVAYFSLMNQESELLQHYKQNKLQLGFVRRELTNLAKKIFLGVIDVECQRQRLRGAKDQKTSQDALQATVDVLKTLAEEPDEKRNVYSVGVLNVGIDVAQALVATGLHGPDIQAHMETLFMRTREARQLLRDKTDADERVTASPNEILLQYHKELKKIHEAFQERNHAILPEAETFQELSERYFTPGGQGLEAEQITKTWSQPTHMATDTKAQNN